MYGSDYGVQLARPLKIKDGRTLLSLGDGVELIGELVDFPSLRPAWHSACDAIQRAAQPGRTAGDIEVATLELELALRQDHLLEVSRSLTDSAPFGFDH